MDRKDFFNTINSIIESYIHTLTINQAALYLNTNVTSLKKIIDKLKIEPIKINNKFHYKIEDIKKIVINEFSKNLTDDLLKIIEDFNLDSLKNTDKDLYSDNKFNFTELPLYKILKAKYAKMIGGDKTNYPLFLLLKKKIISIRLYNCLKSYESIGYCMETISDMISFFGNFYDRTEGFLLTRNAGYKTMVELNTLYDFYKDNIEIPDSDFSNFQKALKNEFGEIPAFNPLGYSPKYGIWLEKQLFKLKKQKDGNETKTNT